MIKGIKGSPFGPAGTRARVAPIAGGPRAPQINSPTGNLAQAQFQQARANRMSPSGIVGSGLA